MSSRIKNQSAHKKDRHTQTQPVGHATDYSSLYPCPDAPCKICKYRKMRNQKEVHIACLEKREATLADDEEIEQAQKEGLQVHPGQTFEAICGGIRS